MLCLSGDPISIGDHPDAKVVNDLCRSSTRRSGAPAARGGRHDAGAEVDDPPRYLIGVADLPLAEPYDVGRLEQKLDAGADVIWTQIVYDVEALAAWAEIVRARGVFERAPVLIGMVPFGVRRAPGS